MTKHIDSSTPPINTTYSHIKPLIIGDLIIPSAIVQGGMGIGISLHGLASAVANEGGVGVISTAGLFMLNKKVSKDNAEASKIILREEIRKSREKSTGAIGLNIMVATSNFGEMVQTGIEEKVDIIFCGAGLPLDAPKHFPPNCHTKLVPIVSSARAAKLIADKWKTNYDFLPDAIVVEGPKAGGHLGFKLDQLENTAYTLEELIPQVVAEMNLIAEKYNKAIPVIAAGGIYSGEDMYKIMKLGASGVQMGTRFVTTDECDASLDFKMSYIHAKKEDIEIIKSPVGMPGRVIKSSYTEKVKNGEKQPDKCPFKCIITCDINTAPYCICSALYNAYKGKLDYGFVFAGANAYKATEIISVKETMSRIVSEYALAEQEN